MKSNKFTLLEPMVIELANNNKTIDYISKKLKLKKSRILTILNKNKVVYGSKKKHLNRRNEILGEIKQGFTFAEIGVKFKISKARVQQISGDNDIYRYQIVKDRKEEFACKVKEDLAKGYSYSELVDKYNINKPYNVKVLTEKGLESLYFKFLKIRNENLMKEYETKTAKEIVEANKHKLNNPNKISQIGSIYLISSKTNNLKFPKIGHRSKGGLFEDVKVIEIIKSNRIEEVKISFTKIAKLLNDQEFLTPQGKIYTAPNVRAKYLSIIKNKL